MKITRHSDFILTIENFWTPEKCEAFIKESESIGYEPALVNTEKGPKQVSQIRNNQRIIFNDLKLAKEIWNNIENHIIKNLGKSTAIGLNEMFRFYKYEFGQEFKKHRDQSFIRNESETSFFTFMIYLNDNFDGGETSFNNIIINPKQGTCLIFLHDLEHEGRKIDNGIKYVLRSDIMYKMKTY